jgi:hypothetical protein
MKRSLSVFLSVDPLPDPLKDLAVLIATGNPVTEPCDLGRPP